MIALIQRTTRAHVSVDKKTVAEIHQGIVALICMENNDTDIHFEKMLHKLVNYRIFEDQDGKMNLSLKDINAELLLVPQFTLAANTEKGLRPSFSNACPPSIAQEKFSTFRTLALKGFQNTQCGIFGANMQVTLTNDGPVTFWLKV